MQAVAQGPPLPTIRGKITDGKGSPLPYASVTIENPKDSAIVTGGVSDDKGLFSVPVNKGTYNVRITFLSFEEKLFPNTVVPDRGVDLGNVELKEGSQEMDEVEIRAEKSQMVLELDKRVFNVGADLANTGRNAAEILDNVPSISVDVDGNVSLRGSQNVRILVDGKVSGLVRASKMNALRQLQGNMIEKIEVITNPSARYDAEGEVGIVNIVLKKGQKDGLNGSFDINTGWPHNHGAAFNINHRRKWLNVFSSFGINYRRSPGRGTTIQNFSGDTTYAFETDRSHWRGGLASNFRAGADIYFNRRNTLTFAGLYKYSNGLNNALLLYSDYNNDILTQLVTRTDDEVETQENVEIDLTYRKTFAQKGRSWSSTFKYVLSDDTELSDFFEYNDPETYVLTQRASNTEDEQNVLVQSDYVHPIGDKGKFEAGVRATLRLIENDYTVEQQASDESWSPLDGFDNHFIYEENIYAAYLMAGNKSGKFSYQGGLRAEYTDLRTELVETQEENPREYLNMFPSVHLGYEFSAKNTLQLSYSRRISRPGFRSLLPFFTFSDNRNYYTGNPDLNPEYTNSWEVGHLWDSEKGSILTSAYYRLRTGVIQRVMFADSNGLTRRFPINMANQNSIGFEMNINYDLTNWWSLTAYGDFYRWIIEGEYEGISLSTDTYTWRVRLSSRMDLPGKMKFQANWRYRAPQLTPQGKRLSRYSLDLSLAKEVLNKKGTITFNVSDLFNTRKWRSITETPGFYSESEFQWRARQFLLSFNYRLRQDKRRERGGRPGGFEGGEGF